MKTDRSDALVIGGGVVGLFSALFLRQAGFQVTLIEAGAIGGAQSASSGNTGYVGTTGSMPLAEPAALRNGVAWLFTRESPLYIRPRASAELASWLWRFHRFSTEVKAQKGFRVLFEMKARSLSILRDLCGRPEFASCFSDGGKLIAFKTQSAFDQARSQAVHLNKRGMSLEVLGRGDVETLEPGVFTGIAGALFNPDDAYLRVPEFVIALREAASLEGVKISENTSVVTIVRETQGLRIETTKGDFRPSTIVLACGAWSENVLSGLKVRLGHQPAKGYSVTIRTPANAPRLPVLLSEGRVAITPLGEKTRLAGILDLVGFDTSLSKRRLETVLKTASSYINVGKAEVIEEWAGLRSCMPDGLPSVGRLGQYPDIIVACGHGHIGMGLAPITGRLVAQIAANEAPELDLTPLAPDRFWH